jgi:hypothetical protein
MKDFKKMPKMACGGSVGKYDTGGKVKSLPEKAGEEAFARQAKKEEAIDDKYGLPSDLSERNHREASRMVQVFDSYNRAKKSVEQGEKTTPMGDTYKRGGKVKRGTKKK